MKTGVLSLEWNGIRMAWGGKHVTIISRKVFFISGKNTVGTPYMLFL